MHVSPLSLATELKNRSSEIDNFSIVTGFDGFVDEMISLVGERHDTYSFKRVETISQFGDLIKAASGKSSLREIVVSQSDPGGCAVNMGDGLASLGVQVNTFATVGEPMHRVFNNYAEKARVHSWGREPGRTLAYEFADGKVMFSSVSQLAEFDAEHVRAQLRTPDFEKACQASQLIALTDWTLFPNMTGCWEVLDNLVFSTLSERKHLFLDLVDPSSRSEADISEMIKMIGRFEKHCRVCLGLNQNEANILSNLLRIPVSETAEATASVSQASDLRKTIGISEVVIHTHRFAVSSTDDAQSICASPYTDSPVKSTGAGDRFNAGYALGLVLGLEPEARLLLGNTVSGSYVRTGVSPSLSSVLDMLENWPASEPVA